MGKQVLPPEIEFGFDEYSLAAVSVIKLFLIRILDEFDNLKP